MKNSKKVDTKTALLVHDVVLGPDLRRDRYRSNRGRILANVLYVVPWMLALLGWSWVRETPSLDSVAVLVPIAVVLILLGSVANLITVRHFCVYPETDTDTGTGSEPGTEGR